MLVRTVLSSSYTGIDGTTHKRSTMNQDEIRRQELSNFLRTRRARISPADVGPGCGPTAANSRFAARRSSAVGRVSVTWYTWLEAEASDQCIGRHCDSLARVLHLNPAERMQLFQLALRQPVVDIGWPMRNS